MMPPKQPVRTCYYCDGSGKTTAEEAWYEGIDRNLPGNTVVWCPWCEKGQKQNAALKQAFRVSRPG